MKTNIEYLRESIEKSMPDTDEWLDAIAEEMKEYENKIASQKEEITKLKADVDELESAVYDEDEENLEEIDCGYGKIWWKSDNLKLQLHMEEFAAKMENKANFGIYNVS